MKLFSILFLKFFLLSNFLVAETLLTKSKILKLSSECLKDPQNQICGELVSQIEQLQLVAFDQNRFKCQTSLLGLQSELVGAYFFKDFSQERISFMLPYVIKNC